MELTKTRILSKLKNLITKIYKDNLFLLSSSISYYAALAIAPFLLILLGVASLLGSEVQGKIISLAGNFSPQVGQLIALIFTNVNEGLNFGSVSGTIGVLVILWTASLVFLQLRYSMDVIYGYHDPHAPVNVLGFIKDKLFAMLLVVMAGIFFILSSSLPSLASYFFKEVEWFKALAFLINLLIYVGMFWGIHSFTPSRRTKSWDALKMSLLSTSFFLLGNILLASYLKSVAAGSIYGAAGTLLVFLSWTYYSSFTLFLSVEIFLFFKNRR